MPISYDPVGDLITLIGSCTFSDIYNADKAGTLQLLPPTSAGPGLSLTTQIRPADDKALKLNIIITDFSVGGVVTLTGLDKDGNPQTEDIDITANGTYVSTLWWKSIDAGGVDCTGTYTIEITQSRWGVVWKQGDKQFKLDCALQIGNGTDTSSLTSEKELIKIVEGVSVKNMATFRLGALKDATQGFGNLGSDIELKSLSSDSGSFIYIYASHVKFYNKDATGWNFSWGAVKGSLYIYESVIQSIQIGWGQWWFQPSTDSDIVEICNSNFAHFARLYHRGLPYSKLKEILYHDFQAPVWDSLKTFREVRNSNVTWQVDYSGQLKAINFEGSWTFNVYYRTGVEFVEELYTFDLLYSDANGDPISAALVELCDVDGNLAFSTSTQEDGKIPQQEVLRWKRSKVDGVDTEKTYTPHTLKIVKESYETIEFKLTIDRKLDMVIDHSKPYDIKAAIQKHDAKMTALKFV